MGIRVSGSFLAMLAIMTTALVMASDRSDAPSRSPRSPHAFVAPESCSMETPCPQGYWAFQPPQCDYHGRRHGPGVVLLLEDGVTLQCRCRLVWLLTKEGQPPAAKVSCAWVAPHDGARDH